VNFKKEQEKAINNFIVLQDTREQLPYKFPALKEQCLPFGDYSLEYDGKQYFNEIIFERKGNVSELYAFSGSERDRFVRELEKMKDVKYKYLLFEFDFMAIVNNQSYGLLPAQTVYATLFSFMIRYNIIPLFCGNRINCRSTMFKLMQFFVKYEILNLR
jgi:hypothetical protein